MGNIIHLEKCILDNHYTCDITRDLDKMSNINTKENPYFYHYICYDKIDLKNNIVCIRVPGGTVGCIKFDPDNHRIINIEIDTNYVVKSYFRNVVKNINNLYKGSILELYEKKVGNI